jgi:glycosyltransferase involved in cell wall biosynthesis
VGRARHHAHFGRDYPGLVLDRHPSIDRDRLWLSGMIPQVELRRLLARSDLHVVASRPHPASRSMVEAMAAGCVVAAIDSGAVREFIEDGSNGLLCGDVDALHASVLRSLRDPDASRPLADAARDRVRERYARDVTLPALVRLFDRLVGA